MQKTHEISLNFVHFELNFFTKKKKSEKYQPLLIEEQFEMITIVWCAFQVCVHFELRMQIVFIKLLSLARHAIGGVGGGAKILL